MDLEFNTKDICLVLPQAIAASAVSADERKIETKGAGALKIRVLGKGFIAGKAVSFALKGGNTIATSEANIITTVVPVADADGYIDSTYYVKVPTDIYQIVRGEATVAADAGETAVVAVDIELHQLRESTNLTETPELYS